MGKNKITAAQFSKEDYDLFTKTYEPFRQKSKNTLTIILMIVCILIGGSFGCFGATFSSKLKRVDRSASMWAIFVFAASVLVLSLVAIIVHEAGHLVFGLLTGYRFLSFRIFSMVFFKQDGKLVRKKLHIPGTAGQCLMLPPDWEEGKPYPYALYNLGGGLANLIFSVLFLPLLLFRNTYVTIAVITNLVFGIYFALTNLIPLSKPIFNDGKNGKCCKTIPGCLRSWYVNLMIVAELYRGKEYDEFSEDLFRIDDDAPLNNTLNVGVLYYKYLHDLLLGRRSEADAILLRLEQHTEEIPNQMMILIACERFCKLLTERAPLPKIAAYYSYIAQTFQINRTDIMLARVKVLMGACLTEKEQLEMDNYQKSIKKNNVPFKPVTREGALNEMNRIISKIPSTGEVGSEKKILNYYLSLIDSAENGDTVSQ